MPAESLQSCPTLCDPRDCDPSGSSIHGILQQEYWSGLPCLAPGNLCDPLVEPGPHMSPALAGSFFTTSTTCLWGECLFGGVSHSQVSCSFASRLFSDLLLRITLLLISHPQKIHLPSLPTMADSLCHLSSPKQLFFSKGEKETLFFFNWKLMQFGIRKLYLTGLLSLDKKMFGKTFWK